MGRDWTALHELNEKDESGNVRIGDAIAIDAANNYLWACEGKHVAVVGVSDLVVVKYGDDILIIPRDCAQQAKRSSNIWRQTLRANGAAAPSPCGEGTYLPYRAA